MCVCVGVCVCVCVCVCVHAHMHFVCFNSIYCVCLTEGNAKLLYADGQDVKLMDVNTKLIEAKQRLSIICWSPSTSVQAW